MNTHITAAAAATAAATTATAAATAASTSTSTATAELPSSSPFFSLLNASQPASSFSLRSAFSPPPAVSSPASPAPSVPPKKRVGKRLGRGWEEVGKRVESRVENAVKPESSHKTPILYSTIQYPYGVQGGCKEFS